MKTFKLLVTDNRFCLQTLRYLDEVIFLVNEMKVRVTIEKLEKADFDPDLVETMRKRGIDRLPALIIPDRPAPVIGYEDIKRIFDKNLNKLNNTARISAGVDPEMGDMLGDYMMREMNQGITRDNGKLKIKDTADESVGDGINENDRTKRMREFEKRTEKRRGTKAREQDIDDEEEAPVRRRAQRNDDEDPHPPPRSRNVDTSGGGGDDEIARQMMDTWMENTTGTPGVV